MKGSDSDSTFASLGEFNAKDLKEALTQESSLHNLRLETDAEADARVAKSLGKEYVPQVPVSEVAPDQEEDLFALELKKVDDEKKQENTILNKIQNTEWYTYEQKQKARETPSPSIVIDFDSFPKADIEAMTASGVEAHSLTTRPELKTLLNFKGHEIFQSFLAEPQMNEYVRGVTSAVDPEVRNLILGGSYMSASRAVQNKENAKARATAMLASGAGAMIGVTGVMFGQIAGEAALMGGGAGFGALVAGAGGLYYMYKKWKNEKAHKEREGKLSLRSRLGRIFGRM